MRSKRTRKLGHPSAVLLSRDLQRPTAKLKAQGNRSGWGLRRRSPACDRKCMKTTQFGTLETQIEALVREHIRELQSMATQAVVRGFRDATACKSRGGHSSSMAAATKANTARRTPAAVSAMSERLYSAICAQPGAGMGVLAAQVGATSQELSLPAALLGRAGRVRTAGQKQNTRYFPMVAKAARS